MNIKQIMDDYNLGPFFGDGYTNHVPMVQSALFHMGHQEEVIRACSDYLVDKWQLKPFEEYKAVKKFSDSLGSRASYLGWIDYFKVEMNEKEIETVVKEALKYFQAGLSSMLFHGLIRLSYAVSDNNKDEIIRALAFFACGYEPIEFKGRQVPLGVIKAEFTRFVQNRDGYFYLKGSENEKEKAIIDALSELYMNTGSFVVLHTITGFHALLTLKDYFSDFNHVIDRFTVCVERSLLRISQDDYKLIEVETVKTYEELFELMADERDAHTIKLVYSTFKLNEMHPNDKLLIAANIRYNERA